AGRVGNLEFRVGRTLAATVEVEVHGNLIDPLSRVSSASIRLVRSDSLEKKPKVGTDGKWTALPKSEKTGLKVDGKQVTAMVALPLNQRDRGQIDFLFQPACVDRDGKTNYFAPVTQTLVLVPAGGEGFPGRPGGGPRGPGGGPVSPPGAGPG